MCRCNELTFFLAAVLALCATTVEGGQLVVHDDTSDGSSPSVQDAGIRGGDASNGNMGDGSKALIEATDTAGALFWFDISSIPAGHTVTSATLDLRLRPNGGAIPDATTAELSRVLEPWGAGPLPVNEGASTNVFMAAQEGEVTWNNREHSDTTPTAWTDPGLLTNGGGSRDMAISFDMNDPVGGDLAGPTGWHVLVDVKDIVQSWVDGDPNYGFVLNAAAPFTDGSGSPYEVGMSEDSDYGQTEGRNSRRPRLTVEYSAVPEPGSLALIGLAGLCACCIQSRRG